GHASAFERERHQKRRDELTRDIAADDHALLPRPTSLGDRQWRESVLAEVADIGTERAQRVDEVFDGTLVHPGHAGKLVVAVRERERGGERPERRARVAQEQPGPLHWKRSCGSAHEKVARFASPLDYHPEDSQRLQPAFHP